ncbi:patatin-like phospholipase family protein [Parasphaerochaeta coccoides]|uniref:Patatin n=1 Tax=Parasphaerochaeta coccoides (strain ATCC BAA-1237 / DSM 17374 / SPN1) TaxID=760011 RepID=F4GI52_PARC1|nr:patatin-like phospholipase family protein [Parasphaerochaeta coccoides]AEC02650.1 Patatin [Parasphaerochaeta coccoides DSM 17374]
MRPLTCVILKVLRIGFIIFIMTATLFPLGAAQADVARASASSTSKEPVVALVLSGGGARGIAHIAVLEAIEERGIPIDMIVGTSMGALVGCLYSAGYSPQDIRDILAAHDLMAMLTMSPYGDILSTPRAFVFGENNLLSLAFGAKGLGNATGLVGDQALMTLLSSLLSKVSFLDDFTELETPYVAVAMDATTSERIVFDSGSLSAAVRSSISLPLVFPPFLLNDGRLTMDGGYVDNLPVGLAYEYGADLVIACEVNAAQRMKTEDLTSLSAMLIQSMDLVTRINVRTQEKLADLLIYPDLEDVGILDFNKYQEILDKSQKTIETSYTAALDEFARSVEEKGRILVPKDSRRRGTYHDLTAPAVVGVQHWEAIVGEDAVRMDDHGILSRYWKYAGKTLDAATLEQLGHDLEMTKKQGTYMSVFFELRENSISEDKDGGTANKVDLHIVTRKGQEQKSGLGIGLQGSGVLSFMPGQSAVLTLLPAIMADMVLYDVLPEDYRLLLSFHGTDILKVQVGIAYETYVFAQRVQLDLDSALSVELGNIGLYSSRLNPQRLTTFDGRSSFSLGATMIWKSSASLSAGMKLSLTTLGPFRATSGITLGSGLSAERRNTASFVGYLQGAWSTMDYSLLPTSGMRVDGALEAGGMFDPTLSSRGRSLWMARARFVHAIPLGAKFSLSYDAEVALSHGKPSALIDSYFQYGGFDGIPGYGSYLVTDKVSLGTTVRYQIGAGVLPMYLVGAMRLGLRGELPSDPGKTVFFMTQAEHEAFDSAPLTVFDMGFLVGVGLTSPLGDAIFGVGVNLRGGVSLAVGFR